MKLLIRIFGGLVAVWLLLLLIGLVLPGHYRVERSVVVAAKPAKIYPLVGDLRSWAKWGVWFERDPAMKISYSPVTSEVGSWSSWTSKSQGDGKMTISLVRPPEAFEYRMDFSDMGMVARGTLVLAPVGDLSTRATMSMEGDLGRSPINRWFGLFMDKLIGPDFDSGLSNLKRLAEAPGA